jgi:Tfp pilus assembly protein PilZ
MQTLTASPDLFAYPLDRRRSARILEQAARSHARVTLQPRSPGDAPELAGVIVAAAPESFCVQLDEGMPDVPPSAASVCCDACLRLGSDQYLFDTSIMAVIDTDTPTRLEVARPDTVQIMQRRRFRRTAVRGSSPVTVRTVGGGAASGTLLNASVDGVACRVATEAADRAKIGDTVRIQFELADPPQSFDLAAVVRSKTPAATEFQTIVGLQFAYGREDREQRHRLTAALTSAQPSPTRSRNHE